MLRDCKPKNISVLRTRLLSGNTSIIREKKIKLKVPNMAQIKYINGLPTLSKYKDTFWLLVRIKTKILKLMHMRNRSILLLLEVEFLIFNMMEIVKSPIIIKKVAIKARNSTFIIANLADNTKGSKNKHNPIKNKGTL